MTVDAGVAVRAQRDQVPRGVDAVPRSWRWCRWVALVPHSTHTPLSRLRQMARTAGVTGSGLGIRAATVFGFAVASGRPRCVDHDASSLLLRCWCCSSISRTRSFAHCGTSRWEAIRGRDGRTAR
jgi:hypothetical protein